MKISISDLWVFIGAFVIMDLGLLFFAGISTPAKVSSSVSAVIALGLVATYSAWRNPAP